MSIRRSSIKGSIMALDRNYIDGFLPTCLLQSLNELRLSGTLCDVRLIVDDKEILAHRAVLAAASPYFKTMFTSNLRETREESVVMQSVEFSVLRDVVTFIYTTELRVTEENVFNFVDMADFMQMPVLRSACLHFLLESLSPSTCLATLQAIQGRCGYRDLEQAAMRFARKHFPEVVESQDFVLLSADILHLMCQGRVLNVPDEGFVLKAIVLWVSSNPPERLKHLDLLASTIHLLQVPMETLVNVKQNPLIENSNLQRQIKSTINTILEERYDMDVRAIWAVDYREKMRRMLRYCDEQEVILVIGGESNGIALESVECFTLGYDSWKCIIPTAVTHAGGPSEDSKVIPTMREPRCFFGIACRDDEVFVLGGATPSGITTSVESYNVQKNAWSLHTVLPVPLRGLKAAFCDGQLFVTGGFRSQGVGKQWCSGLMENIENKTWYLDEKFGRWKEGSPMRSARTHHGLVSVGGSLYALGGKTEGGCILDTVERYDPSAGCWHQVTSMHEARQSFGCAAIGHYIYVMGGESDSNGAPIWLRSVERYNTLTNQWCMMTPMAVGRSCFGISVSDKRLYCLGGFDGIHHLNTVEKYNPRTNRWHCVHAFQRKRYGLGAVSLRIPVISRDVQ